VTAEERAQIQQAARRYVREVAPTPSTAVLEQVARIVLEARGVDQSRRLNEQVGASMQTPSVIVEQAPTYRESA
jgi:hypothetical protein